MTEIDNTEMNKENLPLMHKLQLLEKRVGNTRTVQLTSLDNVFVKTEYDQFGNSIKIRPAIFIIKKAIETNLINKDTVIIESTSGNFGIALSMICQYLGIKFIAVIDSNTPRQKETLLKLFNSKIVKITEKDEFGGYLINRLKYIETYKKNHARNCFHPNQYKNENNPKSYFFGLGQEICDHFEHLDAAVIAVSSGGTISGLSQKLKMKFPELKVVAVDVQGSQVFQKTPFKRNLSGIGSSIRPDHIATADIDRIEILTEKEIIQGGKDLLQEELILGGASSGAAYAVVKRYKKEFPKAKVLFICPDSGMSYLDSIYNII